MFVTQYSWAVFVAYGTNQELFMEKVVFKEVFWRPIFMKLTHCFDKVVLPEIVFPSLVFLSDDMGTEDVIFNILVAILSIL